MPPLRFLSAAANPLNRKPETLNPTPQRQASSAHNPKPTNSNPNALSLKVRCAGRPDRFLRFEWRLSPNQCAPETPTSLKRKGQVLKEPRCICHQHVLQSRDLWSTKLRVVSAGTSTLHPQKPPKLQKEPMILLEAGEGLSQLLWPIAAISLCLAQTNSEAADPSSDLRPLLVLQKAQRGRSGQHSTKPCRRSFPQRPSFLAPGLCLDFRR